MPSGKTLPSPRGPLPGNGSLIAVLTTALDEGRGETTVPWYYGPIAPLQDAIPNVFTRVLSRVPKAP